MALLPSGAEGWSTLPESFSGSPRYIRYNGLTQRLRSFSLWPQNKEQTPQNMADAGLFFTGNGDNVRCFQCGGGLKNWLPGDDPFVEHARWFPGCEFIRKTKGSAFVDTIQENFPRAEDEVDVASANPSNPSSKQEDTELRAIVQRVLKTPAGQSIKEVFSDTIALAAVNKALQLKGWDEKRVNTELLSDIACDLSDIASSLPGEAVKPAPIINKPVSESFTVTSTAASIVPTVSLEKKIPVSPKETPISVRNTRQTEVQNIQEGSNQTPTVISRRAESFHHVHTLVEFSNGKKVRREKIQTQDDCCLLCINCIPNAWN